MFYYDLETKSLERLKYNKELYSSAHDLTICLRDEKSYKICLNNFLTDHQMPHGVK